MAQRISRAKQRIKASAVPFELPVDPDEWVRRRRLVLHVLYLIFNEGYTSTVGDDLHRVELSGEAIRLARMVHRTLPDDGEVTGLLALMLLTDARRPARVDAAGDLVPLTRQDRTRWDRRLITEGLALVAAALAAGPVGEYLVQAAIAGAHDQAARAEDTDWPQILALYTVLKRMSDNPMVALNHAVAVAMVKGPPAAFELLDALDADGRLAGHHRLDAVRGHLHEMSGSHAAAIAHYQAAARKTASIPERDYLTTKAARLAARRPQEPGAANTRRPPT
jgi:predicted RNA polymerase sigma factor